MAESAETETKGDTAAALAALSLETQAKPRADVRCAVVGNVDSGKSTLIGVLTQGGLDNGRGLARERVFTHRHEIESGRTSVKSEHIMGFDKNQQAVYQNSNFNTSAAAKTKSWGKVVAESESVMTFFDLAGHEKYLKTTIAGLTGSFPDYAMVIVNSLAGITKMTKEHLGVVIALNIPIIIVVTKIDLCPENVLAETKAQLTRILRSPAAGKRLPLTIREEKDVATAISSGSDRVVPVFYMSCVTGENLNLLLQYLAQLKSKHWTESKSSEPVRVDLDHTFNVPGVGLVISGTLCSGTLFPNTDLMLGPMGDGTFRSVFVRSVHSKRMPVDYASTGDTVALSIRPTKRKEALTRDLIRVGMVLLDPKLELNAVMEFKADILVLHHASTIKVKYQAVVHCGVVRQTATILAIENEKECLRTNDRSVVLLQFISRAEYLRVGSVFIFREGNTKGLGTVVSLGPYPETAAAIAALKGPPKESNQPSQTENAVAGEQKSESNSEIAPKSGGKEPQKEAGIKADVEKKKERKTDSERILELTKDSAKKKLPVASTSSSSASSSSSSSSAAATSSSIPPVAVHIGKGATPSTKSSAKTKSKPGAKS